MASILGQGPNVALESTSRDLLPPLVRAGEPVVIVPSSALGDSVPAGCRAVKIVKPGLRRQIGVLGLQGVPLRPAVAAFVPMLERQMAPTRARAAG